MEPDDSTEVQPQLNLNLSARRRSPWLRWINATGNGQVVLDGRMLLGSAEGAPLRIADRTVSRVHAELEVRADGVWIRDLGSRNGTWVDGVFVQHARIPEAGKVRVGGTTLTIAFAEQPTEVPLWPHDRFGPLLARSEAMRELFLRLAQYASADAPVLIQGETGTGKDLVAEAIHATSPRADEPFVVVDCAALPESLLESELFGFARGAFTGAVAPRAGAFEAAHGGTVFLDEIGELPLSVQPKLLRVLESRTVRRIGETEHRKIDVRFISATHRDLQAMVATGAFREDLYFRIAVLPAYVPALRARTEDVALLLEHFLSKAPGLHLDAPTLQLLAQRPWTGNVRELRSFAERAMTVGVQAAVAMTLGSDTAVPSRLPAPPRLMEGELPGLPQVRTDMPFKALREQWVDHLEREYMRALVAVHGRNVGAIADHAELDRSYIHRLLRKHDL